MDHDLYNFSALPLRPPVRWPGGARVAISVIINVECGDLALAPLNVREFGQRDYGARVGIFRLIDVLDEFGVKGSIPINDVVLDRSPLVAEEALKRGWELVGHGAKWNEVITSAMPAETEWEYITASAAALKKVTGVAPGGWLGPSLSESASTLHLLAKAGYDYTLDWGNDDQPYDFTLPEGRLSSVPYSPDTSDAVYIQAQSHTPWEFEQELKDHFDLLYAEGAKTGMSMTVGLQAHVCGHPYRASYIRSFLAYAASKSDVWFATAGEVCGAWRGQGA